jgi:deoxyribodipyrimidine photolyase-related protein
VKQKTGPDACPFNPLYWDFLLRNADKLNQNPRLRQVYRTWDRMAADKREDYLRSAKNVLERLLPDHSDT